MGKKIFTFNADIFCLSKPMSESKWGHKRKYNRGRMNNSIVCVFGLIQLDMGKVCLILIVPAA